MKKYILNKNYWKTIALLGMMVISMLFVACENNDIVGGPITISKVYLEDVNSSVPDKQVTFARLGQVLRIEGSGFTGLKKVYINGLSSYFNPVYVSDNSIVVSVPRETPTIEADEAVRNTIRFVNDNHEFTLTFEIRAAAPTITSISHTMPQAGESITIYGTGLIEVSKVVFPGDIEVTEGIISDNVDGEFCTVIVPEGVSEEGGSVLVIGANGGAYSPANFNFKNGLFQDFDTVNNYSWASGITNAGTPITDIIPTDTEGPKSQGGYQSFNAAGNSIVANADVRYWTNSTNWPSGLLSVISGNTAAEFCAVQMDIYVVGEWNSGVIRMVMADGSGASRYSMIYRPWYENDEIIPFENPGSWFTITLPFSDSDDYVGKTFADVVTSMANASYKQAGPWFQNMGVTDVVDPAPTNVNIYFDNLRVVPLNTPTFSDFPE